MLCSTLFSTAVLFFGLSMAAPLSIDKNDVGNVNVEVKPELFDRRDAAVPTLTLPQALQTLEDTSSPVLSQINAQLQKADVSASDLTGSLDQLSEAVAHCNEQLEELKLKATDDMSIYAGAAVVGVKVDGKVTKETVAAIIALVEDLVAKIHEEVETTLNAVLAKVVDLVAEVQDDVADIKETVTNKVTEIKSEVKVTVSSVNDDFISKVMPFVLDNM